MDTYCWLHSTFTLPHLGVFEIDNVNGIDQVCYCCCYVIVIVIAIVIVMKQFSPSLTLGLLRSTMSMGLTKFVMVNIVIVIVIVRNHILALDLCTMISAESRNISKNQKHTYFANYTE